MPLLACLRCRLSPIEHKRTIYCSPCHQKLLREERETPKQGKK